MWFHVKFQGTNYLFPLVIAMKHGPFTSMIHPLKIGVFHTYLELPEGVRDIDQHFLC